MNETVTPKDKSDTKIFVIIFLISLAIAIPLDESTEKLSNVKMLMLYLDDCVEDVEVGQSVKIIKESRPTGPDGIHADIKVEYSGFE